jgi:spectinomycin phosphotransferase
VTGVASRTDLRLPGRVRLHVAMRELDRPWTTGPYAEPARKTLAAGLVRVEGWLDEFDRLVARVRAEATDWVVTHGEPHPGNVIWTPDGLRLIDWDTVQIAPPERDLWMVADEQSLARYDKPVSTAGLALYRLWWKLADVAAYVDDLRRPHRAGGDAEAALAELNGYLDDATR